MFNLYTADRELKNRNIGGTAVDSKDRNLAYADDIVLLAKNRIALINMMDTLRRFKKK